MCSYVFSTGEGDEEVASQQPKGVKRALQAAKDAAETRSKNIYEQIFGRPRATPSAADHLGIASSRFVETGCKYRFEDFMNLHLKHQQPEGTPLPQSVQGALSLRFKVHVMVLDYVNDLKKGLMR